MNDSASSAFPVSSSLRIPSVPLAKATVSFPIFLMAGLDTITFDTLIASSRVSCLPVVGPAISTEFVAPGLKCEIG